MEYDDLRSICLTQRAIRAAVCPDVFAALILERLPGAERTGTIALAGSGLEGWQGFIRLRWVPAGHDPYLGQPTQAQYTDIYKHPHLLPNQVGIMARQPE